MFETFDIKSFGKYLKELRISLSYTQKDIVKLSGISIDSLRRVETGAVLPRYDTLVNLSLAYNKDLLEDLKSYRNNDVLFGYYSRLDNLILKYDLSALKDLENDFNEFSKSKNDGALLNVSIREQFNLLLKGISVFHSGNRLKCLDYFVKAMKVSIPTFEPEKFESFNYNQFESRILMQIAIALGVNGNKIMSISILKTCLEISNFDVIASDNEKLTICKLYFQLAYDSHSLDNYEDVIFYSHEGIDYCNKHNLTYFLAGLFYRKGIAEFRLGIDGYIFSLRKSISILLITNNEKLAEMYIQVTKDNYDIELNIDEF